MGGKIQFLGSQNTVFDSQMLAGLAMRIKCLAKSTTAAASRFKPGTSRLRVLSYPLSHNSSSHTCILELIDLLNISFAIEQGLFAPVHIHVAHVTQSLAILLYKAIFFHNLDIYSQICKGLLGFKGICCEVLFFSLFAPKKVMVNLMIWVCTKMLKNRCG